MSFYEVTWPILYFLLQFNGLFYNTVVCLPLSIPNLYLIRIVSLVLQCQGLSRLIFDVRIIGCIPKPRFERTNPISLKRSAQNVKKNCLRSRDSQDTLRWETNSTWPSLFLVKKSLCTFSTQSLTIRNMTTAYGDDSLTCRNCSRVHFKRIWRYTQLLVILSAVCIRLTMRKRNTCPKFKRISETI